MQIFTQGPTLTKTEESEVEVEPVEDNNAAVVHPDHIEKDNRINATVKT